jgi:hypothetical protein
LAASTVSTFTLRAFSVGHGVAISAVLALFPATRTAAFGGSCTLNVIYEHHWNANISPSVWCSSRFTSIFTSIYVSVLCWEVPTASTVYLSSLDCSHLLHVSLAHRDTSRPHRVHQKSPVVHSASNAWMMIVPAMDVRVQGMPIAVLRGATVKFLVCTPETKFWRHHGTDMDSDYDKH